MQTFYICDAFDPVRRTMPCVFTERTMASLWKRTGGDIARCPRHGSLICNEERAESKKEIQQGYRKAMEQ